MKKLILIVSFLTVFSFLISGCGGNSQGKTNENAEIDQDFLDDVVKATDARWKLAEKETDAEDETKEYYNDLVHAEYDIISKYKDKEFSDVKLKALSEQYLEGIETQKEALKYFNVDGEKFDELWSKGYDQRSTALLDLQDEYNVKLDEKNFADLKTNAQIVKKEDEYNKKIDKMIKNIKFDKRKEEYGWYTYTAVVENTSGISLNYLELNIDLLDEEGVVIDTAYVDHYNVWKPGQKIELEFETDENIAKMEWTADYDYTIE